MARLRLLAFAIALGFGGAAHAVTELATVETPGSVQEVLLEGTLGYVADGLGGVRIFDLSTPALPVEIAALPPIPLGNVRALARDADRLYTAEQVGGISIIDVASPAAPLRLGSVSGFGVANDVVASGDYAYVVSNQGPGFYVVDVSDPGDPVQVASLPATGFSVSLVGPTRVVAGNQVIDISDPLNPVIVSEPLPFTDAIGDGFGVDTTPARWDLTDPGNPVLVNQWLAPFSVAAYSAVGLTGELAWLVGTSAGLAVFDVSDAQPTHPIVDSMAVGSSPQSRVRIVGTRAYVTANSGARGLHVIDVGDPADLTALGHFSAQFMDVDVAGSFAYAVDRFDTLGSAGLYVIDVSNPAAMTQVAFVPIQFPSRVRVDGSRAYVLDADQIVDELLVFDVTNPAAPVQIGSIPGLDGVQAIEASGNLLYLLTATGATTGNLLIFDATNPAAIVPLASYPTTGQPKGLAVAAGRAYIASDIVEVVNVVTPFAPGLFATFDLPDTSFHDPEPKGSRLHVGASGGHFLTVDFADPLAPRAIGTSVFAARNSAPSSLGDAATGADGVLLVSFQTTLFAFDTAQASGLYPLRLATFPSIAGSKLVVDGDRDLAFVSDGRLRIVDIADERALHECANGLDDDGDASVDHGDDAGCRDGHDASEEPDCADGLDDDGDGKTDFPTDPSCATAAEASEAPNCDDGTDGDGDGFADFGSDPGCVSRLSELENPACQNGADDDGDGKIDFDGGASANGDVPLAAADGQCPGPARNSEAAGSCGLGGELAVALLAWRRIRRMRDRDERRA